VQALLDTGFITPGFFEYAKTGIPAKASRQALRQLSLAAKR